jgi:LDH2 family malate/lactate/ureidoglycolate dehydrogenase
MSSLIDTITAKANASDSSWVDDLVTAIQGNVGSITDTNTKNAIIDATLTLQAQKDNIASLGVYALTSVLQCLAAGDVTGAQITFIKTQASFEDLIEGENSDAATIIAAKQASDAAKAKAETVALAFAQTTAQILLPVLLTLLI